MKRISVFIFCCLICAAPAVARAQVAPTAYRGRMTLTAGGLASAFQPDYAGQSNSAFQPEPSSSPQWLFGFGAYVDFQTKRWLGVEAEGRWLRLNTYVDINEDNYLIGPRVPIHEFKRLGATTYGKALFGLGRMNFQYSEAYGRFSDIALGGGVDFKVSKRFSVRACDFEYQIWPNWINGTVKPYGVTAGIGYKIF